MRDFLSWGFGLGHGRTLCAIMALGNLFVYEVLHRPRLSSDGKARSFGCQILVQLLTYLYDLLLVQNNQTRPPAFIQKPQ